MHTIAVIPLKPVLSTSKSRLSGVIHKNGRIAMTLMMLANVIKVIEQSKVIQQTAIIGGDSWIEDIHPSLRNVHWIKDNNRGLNQALLQGISFGFDQHADSVLFLPADLPLITKEDLCRLVETSHGGKYLVISPAKRDKGTNAILIPREVDFRPCLGKSSFSKHWQQSVELGFQTAIYYSTSLGIDLDTVNDLKACQELLPHFSKEIEEWERYILDYAKLSHNHTVQRNTNVVNR